MTPDLLNAVLSLAATVLIGIGSVAVNRLADWLKLKADGHVRDYLRAALDHAVEYGLAHARRELGAAGVAAAGADGQRRLGQLAVEVAAGYVADRVPDALDRFGIDDAALHSMLAARMVQPQRGLDSIPLPAGAAVAP